MEYEGDGTTITNFLAETSTFLDGMVKNPYLVHRT